MNKEKLVKKLNKKVLLMSIVCLFITILGVVLMNNTKEVNASPIDYFKKTKIDNCVVVIEKTEFEWTGEAIKPMITVTDDGSELVENKDYALEYKNNEDAGDAKVIVKGINKYRGKKKVKFRILGINIEKQCIISKDNGIIKVYDGDKILGTNDYYINKVRESDHMPINCTIDIQNKKGIVNYSYDVKYLIEGTGQYIGTIYTTLKKTYQKEVTMEEAIKILQDIQNPEEPAQ